MGISARAAAVPVGGGSADGKNLSEPCQVILKLKQTPGLYLVGFMGSGKTTIGRLLAERLGWTFVDIDEAIETSESRPIAEIFDTLGEDAFRRIKRETIARQVRAVACGRP